MKKVRLDMTINEIISIDKELVKFLMEAGMHCVGCPSAQSETLSEAGFVHGEDVEEIVKKMNNFLEEKKLKNT